MDAGIITQIGLSVVTCAAGWSVGRRGVAREVIDMLQDKVTLLEEQKLEGDQKVTALEGKVEVLESLVTQRAAVEEVRDIVVRIADRVGA